jgi:hypothetical protein
MLSVVMLNVAMLNVMAPADEHVLFQAKSFYAYSWSYAYMWSFWINVLVMI